MSFPISPTNGQTITINNVVYTYNAGNNSWTGAGVTTNTSTSTKFYTSATPPIGPNVGDRWYKTTTDVMYEYVNDGAGNVYWIDIYTQQNVYNNRKFTTSATPPIGPLLGDMWYNSSSDTLFAYIQDGAGGSYWVDISTRAFAPNNTPVFNTVTVSNSMVLPSGTLASRPNTGVSSGTMRINTDTNYVEFYYNSSWVAANYIGSSYISASNANANVSTSGGYSTLTFNTSGTFTISAVYGTSYLEMLIVGAGGGGGGTIAGGGGGGGILYTSTLSPSVGTYTVTVGAGGIGGLGYTAGNEPGTSGGNSSVVVGSTTYMSRGGGGGGSYNTGAGKDGGSGGGGAGYSGTFTPGASVQSSYSGFSNYGYAGGTGITEAPGGGGGAGAAGNVGVSGQSGNAGIGASFTISGSAVYYAGGGGAGARSGTALAGVGGSGGGGSGIVGSTLIPSTQNGNANTGGGGGGGGYTGTSALQVGGTGGSGLIIIKYKSS
jgi:hypothetical protein